MERQLSTTSPNFDHQEALAYCERAWPEWMEAKAKADRAGGNSAEANLRFHDANAHMDYLLEDLFRQTVTIEGVPDGRPR